MSQKSSVAFPIVSLGAAWLSWSTWHSVGWAVFHAMCGGFYLLYYAVRYWLLT